VAAVVLVAQAAEGGCCKPSLARVYVTASSPFPIYPTPVIRQLVADRLVQSLARGELKRLTVAVELASNPSLIFCDEVGGTVGSHYQTGPPHFCSDKWMAVLRTQSGGSRRQPH
jgi:ABC-type glutathione transport system ATPase component